MKVAKNKRFKREKTSLGIPSWCICEIQKQKCPVTYTYLEADKIEQCYQSPKKTFIGDEAWFMFRVWNLDMFQ